MDTATCPTCGQDIAVATAFIYPDGDVRLLQGHGDDRDPDNPVVACPGGHTRVAA